MHHLFRSVQTVADGLLRQQYICNRTVATTLFLAAHLGKPLLVEGPAGVGKTALAQALAGALNTPLVRLQCYPGLDEAKALYEWNYQKQLLYIQVAAGSKQVWEELRQDIYTPEFLLARPLLKAFLSKKPVVLLVDEVDKSDEELESFLLEALSEFQVSIPELGTIRARHIPFTLLTSNSSREFSDALKRRCLHLYIPYPTAEQERAIVALKVPGIDGRLAAQVVDFVHNLRRLPLKKSPSIAETLDFARTMLLLEAKQLEFRVVAEALNVLLKYQEDVEKVMTKLGDLLPEVREEDGIPAAQGTLPRAVAAGEETEEEPGGVDLSRFNF
ncbi:AAA family ATPase [Desulfofundulus thermosubterraneus]|uniref:MoxR-like ATPase n=1 Tax=Desulfofundulus thermosubterraneus DSM 16057 TaxID=1121432 RepID=A0A1M6L803_9FIRM|nr:MoxR family ATPase [Desulfofundulus thermosubterraneus]SHJ67295.1 MoxR-like ATPase [Desulfofundulus thermosubterraneus DSM 16057]